MNEQLQRILALFSEEDNVVIGGSVALQFHGFSVAPNDIDLIIYSPSERQKELLKILAVACKDNPFPYDTRRSYNIPASENGAPDIDLLVEEGYPKTGIRINYGNTWVKIQTIPQIVDAWRRYEHEGVLRNKDYNKMKSLLYSILI